MVYEADTLMQALQAGWDFTNDLEKEGTVNAATRPFPVKFFAHTQPKPQEYQKAVVIRKISPLINEFFGEFFKKQSQNFEIEVRIRLEGTSKTSWDATESLIEDMEEKVLSILDTVYSPFTGTGGFFESDRTWRNEDNLTSQSPVLVRVLTLTLRKIISRSTGVFKTFQRGVLINKAASNPSMGAGTYQLTEVFDISARQGYRLKQIQVTSHPDGQGIPLNYAGGFDGSWIARSYLKAADIGSEQFKINHIYERVSSGEHTEVVLIETYVNDAGQTLTKTTTIIITEVVDEAPLSNLNTFQMIGKIIKPSTWVVA